MNSPYNDYAYSITARVNSLQQQLITDKTLSVAHH